MISNKKTPQHCLGSLAGIIFNAILGIPLKLGTAINVRRKDCPNGLAVRAQQGNALVLACVFALQNRPTGYSILTQRMAPRTGGGKFRER